MTACQNFDENSNPQLNAVSACINQIIIVYMANIHNESVWVNAF